MSKFTAGPWRTIEGTGQVDWECGFARISGPRWDANARLIAAAPDLLSLAESLALDPYALTPDQWASEARAAIARVEL